MKCAILENLSTTNTPAPPSSTKEGLKEREASLNQQPQQDDQGQTPNRGLASTEHPSALSACQVTLQDKWSPDLGSLDLTNYGNNIFRHGPSHQGPRVVLVVHTEAPGLAQGS
ncbi:unnamed protein product [Amaranthus hypochondriacus]